MATPIVIYKLTKNKIQQQPIVDGHLYFETDQGNNGKIYLDQGTKRIKIGGSSTMITANKVAVSDSNGDIVASTVTPTELNYLSGVGGMATVGNSQFRNISAGTNDIGEGVTLESGTLYFVYE